jgi:hypothetical protein
MADGGFKDRLGECRARQYRGYVNEMHCSFFSGNFIDKETHRDSQIVTQTHSQYHRQMNPHRHKEAHTYIGRNLNAKEKETACAVKTHNQKPRAYLLEHCTLCTPASTTALHSVAQFNAIERSILLCIVKQHQYKTFLFNDSTNYKRHTLRHTLHCTTGVGAWAEWSGASKEKPRKAIVNLVGTPATKAEPM